MAGRPKTRTGLIGEHNDSVHDYREAAPADEAWPDREWHCCYAARATTTRHFPQGPHVTNRQMGILCMLCAAGTLMWSTMTVSMFVLGLGVGLCISSAFLLCISILDD